MIRFGVIFTIICLCAGVAGVEVIDMMLDQRKYPRPHDYLTDAINEHRQRNLYNDTRLDCAAQAHADDILARRTCTGIGRLGETAKQRAEDCQFPWMGGQWLIVCNVDKDLVFDHITSDNDMNMIMLDPNYRYIGVGQSSGYFVILFAE